jgi:hypothetical protein
VGMVSVGLVAVPQMGRLADHYVCERLPGRETAACLKAVAETYPALAAQASVKTGDDIRRAAEAARAALTGPLTDGAVSEKQAAGALRQAIAAAPKSAPAQSARELLNPAENHGGRMTFRIVAMLSTILTAVFGALYLRDRARGGYKVEKL